MEHVLPDDARVRDRARAAARRGTPTGWCSRTTRRSSAGSRRRRGGRRTCRTGTWRTSRAGSFRGCATAARPTTHLHQMMVLNPARLLTPRTPAETMTMRTSIATVCLSGTLTEKLHALRRGRLRRGRDLRARPGRLTGEPGGDRGAGRPAGALARPVPAVPRRRGRHRGRVRAGAAPGPGEVRPDAAARHRHHARVQQRRHRDDRRRRGLGRPAATPGGARLPSTACGSPTRRWPGAATSTTTGGPGGSSSWPTTTRSGVCLDSFHILSRGHDPAAIEEIPGDKIFFLQLADAPALTMDVLSWIAPPPPVPGGGRLRPRRRSSRTSCGPGTTDRCRWRSSTTSSGRPRSCGPRTRRGGRSPGWRTRSAAAAAAAAAGRRHRRRGFDFVEVQGRGHRRGRRPPRTARLHLPRPAPEQGRAAVGRRAGAGRLQRAARPRLGAHARRRRVRGG